MSSANGDVDLPFDDLSGLPPEQRESHRQELFRREFRTPFDLEVSEAALRLLLTGGDRLRRMPEGDLPFTLV